MGQHDVMAEDEAFSSGFEVVGIALAATELEELALAGLDTGE